MNERFWDNLEIILAEKELTWAELARKVFNGQYVYPSEFNRLYQKLATLQIQSSDATNKMVERIVLVLDIDYEDLFKRCTMIRVVVFYLAIQLNGLLVSLYLKEYLTIEGIVLLQLVLLSVTCLEIARHKTVQLKIVAY